MIPDSSLEQYFTEAIYRDDVPLTLRYIVLAIYRRNDVSYIGDISEEQSAINDDNSLHYFCTLLCLNSYDNS